GGVAFATLSGGGGFLCGLTTGGAAYCWGSNEYGQLGDGTQIDHLTQAPVLGGLTFVALGAGASHVCGLTPAGTVYCWGRNNYGQLGDGTAVERHLPVKILAQP